MGAPPEVEVCFQDRRSAADPQGRESDHAEHRFRGFSETPVQERPRVHLDLYAGNAEDQAAEVRRLLGLGAQRVAWDSYPPDADFVVLADPEGNRFCVIDTGRE
ncbi:VOC family protein [Streptomyces scabiei]|uniref:VOC family protein n=1 Tax=Streptomyces scabiei TaxID=1930 RepID=UPI0036D01FD8